MKRLVGLAVPMLALILPATAGKATNVGNATVYAPGAKHSKGVAQAYRFTARSGGRVERLSVYLHETSTATKVTVGLYTGSRSSARTRRGRCSITSPRAGAWNTCSFAGYKVTAGAYYWLALLQPSRSKGRLRCHEGRRSRGALSYLSKRHRLSSLPSSWRNGAARRGGRLASISASGADSDLPIVGGPPPTSGGGGPLPPAPSPSPTPTSGGFPDASNTGVPAGTSLTSVSGNLNVTTNGATVDAKNVTGCINVSGTGVTIKNSRAKCVSMSGAARNTANPRLTVQDSEFDCGDVAGSVAIGDINYTAIRVDVSRCENGFDADSDVTVQDSYVHDLYQGNGSDDPHTDGLQSAFGDRLLIDHNTIYATTLNCAFGPVCNGTSALALDHITSETSTDTTVSHNLLAGGGYTIYCPHDPTSNFHITGNHFSTIFRAKVGSAGPSTNCNDTEILSGNVYHETGRPIRLG